MIYMIGSVEYKADISPNYRCNALGGVTTSSGENYNARHSCHYVDGFGEKVAVTQSMIDAYSSTWNRKDMCVFESSLESSLESNSGDIAYAMQVDYVIEAAKQDPEFFMNRNWRYYDN